MPFYEVIYETGEHSVVSGDDDAQVLRGIAEQHRRATQGEPGGPSGIMAVRVKRVLKYDEHPGSRYESQAVPVKMAKDLFDAAVKDNAMGDLVSIPEIVAALREGVNALVTSGPHESNYKAQEVGELDSKLWEVAA